MQPLIEFSGNCFLDFSATIWAHPQGRHELVEQTTAIEILVSSK